MAKAKTDKEIQYNRRLDHMVYEGGRRTNEFNHMGKSSIRYIYGDQHAGKKRKQGWEYPVMNRMYSDVLQEVAILSSNNPRMESSPVEDTDIDTAKVIGSVLQGMWNVDLRMRLKIIQGLLDDHIYGIKIAKVFWDPKVRFNDEKANSTGKGWEGEIQVNIIKPDYFFCDPNVELAVEIPTKAAFCGTQRWVDKLWAAQRWPKYKKHLEELGEYDRLIEQGISGHVQDGLPNVDETNFSQTTKSWSGRDPFSEKTVQSRLADILLGETKGNQSIYSNKNENLVKLEEFYYRDYETEHVDAVREDEELGQGDAISLIRDENTGKILDTSKPLMGVDSNGNETNETTGFKEFKGDFPSREVRSSFERPKYPNGRMAIRLDREVIVEDREYPFRRWPFFVSVHSLLPHIWNGLNAVELSRGFQDWMNTIASHMTNYIKFFSDPLTLIEKWALDKNEGKKKKSFIPNWAGAIVVLAKGALSSGAIKRETPPQLPATLFQIFDLFKESDQDLKGIHDVAQGRAAGGDTTLGEVQLLNRNTRQRIGMQGAFLDEWLNQIANHIVDLMQAHFTVGQFVRYTGKSKDDLSGTIKWTQKMADAKFDIKLEAASTLPTDEQRDIAKYLQAFQITGPSMLEEVLKKMKIQNVDEILKKHVIVGPLQKMIELANEAQIPIEQIVSMIEAQIGSLTEQIDKPTADKIMQGPNG